MKNRISLALKEPILQQGFEIICKENAELRTRCNELFLQTMQLTNAKEIIKEFVEWANWQGNSKCPSFKSIQDKAEQFIKDSEVEK